MLRRGSIGAVIGGSTREVFKVTNSQRQSAASKQVQQFFRFLLVKGLFHKTKRKQWDRIAHFLHAFFYKESIN